MRVAPRLLVGTKICYEAIFFAGDLKRSPWWLKYPSICFSPPGMCWGGGTFSYPNIPHLLYIFQVDWLQPPLASSNEGIGSMMRSKCHKESSLVVEMRGVFVGVGVVQGGDNSYLGQMMKIATNTQNSSLIAKAASSALWGGRSPSWNI